MAPPLRRTMLAAVLWRSEAIDEYAEGRGHLKELEDWGRSALSRPGKSSATIGAWRSRPTFRGPTW